MADVKALIKKRGTIKASISRVNTFADNFDPDINDHHALKIKLRHLKMCIRDSLWNVR